MPAFGIFDKSQRLKYKLNVKFVQNVDEIGQTVSFFANVCRCNEDFCYYVLFFFRAQAFIDRERHACWMYAAKRCPGTYSPAAIIAWRNASAAPKSSRRSASFVALARARAGSPVGFEASETSAGTNSHSSIVRRNRLILVRQYFFPHSSACVVSKRKFMNEGKC